MALLVHELCTTVLVFFLYSRVPNGIAQSNYRYIIFSDRQICCQNWFISTCTRRMLPWKPLDGFRLQTPHANKRPQAQGTCAKRFEKRVKTLQYHRHLDPSYIGLYSLFYTQGLQKGFARLLREEQHLTIFESTMSDPCVVLVA